MVVINEMILLILIGIFFILILALIIILSIARFYFTLYWSINEEEQMVILSVHLLKIRVYYKEIELDSFDFSDNKKTSTNKKKDLRLIGSLLLDQGRLEQFEVDAIIGTGEPDTTAILYGLCKGIMEALKNYFSTKTITPIHCNISADFDEEILETEGICMISLKMRKTIRALRKNK